MGAEKFDQFVKDLKKLDRIRLKIDGKEIDLRLKGTYKEIKSQYRKLARLLHEDALETMKNEGRIEAKDIGIAKDAIRYLNGVYSYLDEDKSNSGKRR